jgi:hypothetical protein
MTTTTSTNTGDFAKYPGMFTPAQVCQRPRLVPPSFCPCRVQTLSRTLKSTRPYPCVYFHHPLDRTGAPVRSSGCRTERPVQYPYLYETGQIFHLISLYNRCTIFRPYDSVYPV